MNRAELEHGIRAATEIIQADEVIIIGSQSVLGTWSESELPVEATASNELDVLPLNDTDSETLATRLSGVAGELSSFDATHGFHLDGVGRRTAVLPRGWEGRLFRVQNDNTRGRIGWCLDPHDLCVAKLVANRDKDRSFVSALVRHGLIDPELLLERLVDTDLDDATSDTVWSTAQGLLDL
ncbi:DUF6036 family nucleotidyltransferase [Rathayibacter sp. VKM Ac-2926]|uniref:DUF6036 family nucleotidyltransferase n=1 Tax=Rathayibacter sp. VKM Ac-2926 TaxID=2929477 RepID=UPI001FB4A081|nr:DUF6036 family nucleotidyltransferase [Rathayibacter sp. VKM Ac-2926]MCJ1705441.1 hypothetical protein [Rathayibacter sp. VKM Ac-2926]